MAKTTENRAGAPILDEGFLGEVAQILAIGEDRAVRPPVVNPDGSITHFVAEGMRAHTVPALDPALPTFVTQSETMIEPKSFTDYIVQFKSPTAICRASLGQNSIVAVLDYHGRAREGGDVAVPGRGAHVATLKCPFDVDYAKWRAVFGKFLDQQKMVEFIEEMIHTIAEPAAADLLEAMGDIEIERVVRFKSARNDRNGNIKFAYEEQDDSGTTRGGEYSLPEHVVIVVPIFQGGNPVSLTAKLRHRMDKGELTLGLAVPGIENLEREAFRSIGESVREQTSTPVFYVA
ncbi:MAG TPA: DUF2303 family protein [Devosiaceae bacterium]|jgi:hypothetical protein|nr:DUF2303 family protein [Devosiaceae bacterium]